MTREQIEIKASSYIAQSNDDDYAEAGDIKRAFIDGARWRVNSVWQKPTPYGEELKMDVEVIAKTKRGFRFGKFDVLGCSHEYIAFVSTSSLEYSLSDVLEYAYLPDLLPERRRKQNENRNNIQR